MDSTNYLQAIQEKLAVPYEVYFPWETAHMLHKETYNAVGGDEEHGTFRVSFDGDSEYILKGVMIKTKIPDGSVGVFAHSIKNGSKKAIKFRPIAILTGNRLEILWRPSRDASSFNGSITATDEAMIAHIKKVLHVATPNLRDALLAFRSLRSREIEDAIEGKNRYVSDYMAALVRTTRETQELLAQLAAAKQSDQPVNADKFIRYVERNRHIVDVSFVAGTLAFTTQNIIMHDQSDDVDRKLPRYHVSIQLGNPAPTITLADYTDVPDGHAIHPHVKNNERPCLGNYTEIYAKIAMNGELSQLIDLLLEYLRNHNPSSHYTTPSNIADQYADNT